MPVHCRRLAAASLFLVLTVSCGTPEPPPSTAKLKIELFWSDAVGSVKLGAIAAQKTERFKDIDDLIEFEFQLDPDSSDEVARLARDIRLKPDVLAVIGHSRSATTRAALPFYAEADIPVLIPAATSPYAIYEFDDLKPWPSVQYLGKSYPRFSNAFRLPPSDFPDQVEAIMAVTKRITGMEQAKTDEDREAIKAKNKVMIICETTKRIGSDVYTKPMCDSLRQIQDQKFTPLIARYREIDLGVDEIYGLVTEIHAVRPQLIILIGYPEFAQALFQELEERVKGEPQKPSHYTFIASDACLRDDLASFDSKIYVTSPINRKEALDCGSDEAKILRDDVRRKTRKEEPTDETFAFDAVLILASAIKQCKQTLDRKCINEYLETNHESLSGACQKYHLDQGERKNASYSVYVKCQGKFRPIWSVEKGGIHEDDKCLESSR